LPQWPPAFAANEALHPEMTYDEVAVVLRRLVQRQRVIEIRLKAEWLHIPDGRDPGAFAQFAKWDEWILEYSHDSIRDEAWIAPYHAIHDDMILVFNADRLAEMHRRKYKQPVDFP
jgi:hypothetical protein